MAIAFDAASSAQGSSVASLTWAHVVAAGANRLLVVGTNAGDATGADRPVTGITYDGVALTKIRHDEAGTARTELWYLVDPNTGSNNIIVSYTGVNTDAQAGGISLTGVDQSTPLDANNGATGSDAAPTVSVTTLANNAWVVDSLIVGNSPAITVGAGQTERWSEDNVNSRGRGSTEGPVTPAGATTMSWSLDAGNAWRISAASFVPANEVTPDFVESGSEVFLATFFSREARPDLVESGSEVFPPFIRFVTKIPGQRPASVTPGLAEYKVRLKDQSGSLVAEFDTWRSMAFTHHVNQIKMCQIDFDANKKINNIPLPDFFELDGQIEIWRRNLAVNLDWYIEWDGFFRTPHDFFAPNDNRTFRAYGVGYLDLARRANIMWHAASSEANKSAVGETAMKEYVSENIGVAALLANGRIADHVFSGLTIQADLGTGATWEGDRAFQNLLDVLQEISLQSQLDFDIVDNGAAQYQFQVYEQRGADRTTDGLDPATGRNAAGNVPVIFSTDFANMAVPAFSFDRLTEINKVFVLGAGQVDERDVSIIREDTTLQDDSPWNEIEGIVAAGQELEDDALRAIGDAELAALIPVENIAGKVKQIRNTYYGKDYTWGDRITQRFGTREFNKTIMGARVTVNAQVGGERVDLDFGERDQPELVFAGITGEIADDGREDGRWKTRNRWNKDGGRAKRFEARDTAWPSDKVFYKNTAGDFPAAQSFEGMRVVNTVDNTYKIFTNGAWQLIV